MLHPHEEYGREVIETMMSLEAAMSVAHGQLSDGILNMTVRDFVLLIASNGIRFCHQIHKESKDDQPKE